MKYVGAVPVVRGKWQRSGLVARGATSRGQEGAGLGPHEVNIRRGVVRERDTSQYGNLTKHRGEVWNTWSWIHFEVCADACGVPRSARRAFYV